jgi:hypothetical protein
VNNIKNAHIKYIIGYGQRVSQNYYDKILKTYIILTGQLWLKKDKNALMRLFFCETCVARG